MIILIFGLFSLRMNVLYSVTYIDQSDIWGQWYCLDKIHHLVFCIKQPLPGFDNAGFALHPVALLMREKCPKGFCVFPRENCTHVKVHGYSYQSFGMTDHDSKGRKGRKILYFWRMMPLCQGRTTWQGQIYHFIVIFLIVSSSVSVAPVQCHPFHCRKACCYLNHKLGSREQEKFRGKIQVWNKSGRTAIHVPHRRKVLCVFVL